MATLQKNNQYLINNRTYNKTYLEEYLPIGGTFQNNTFHLTNIKDKIIGNPKSKNTNPNPIFNFDILSPTFDNEEIIFRLNEMIKIKSFNLAKIHPNTKSILKLILTEDVAKKYNNNMSAKLEELFNSKDENFDIMSLYKLID